MMDGFEGRLVFVLLEQGPRPALEFFFVFSKEGPFPFMATFTPLPMARQAIALPFFKRMDTVKTVGKKEADDGWSRPTTPSKKIKTGWLLREIHASGEEEGRSPPRKASNAWTGGCIVGFLCAAIRQNHAYSRGFFSRKEREEAQRNHRKEHRQLILSPRLLRGTIPSDRVLVSACRAAIHALFCGQFVLLPVRPIPLIL